MREKQGVHHQDLSPPASKTKIMKIKSKRNYINYKRCPLAASQAIFIYCNSRPAATCSVAKKSIVYLKVMI